jgi:hypothetical protein
MRAIAARVREGELVHVYGMSSMGVTESPAADESAVPRQRRR